LLAEMLRGAAAGRQQAAQFSFAPEHPRHKPRSNTIVSTNSSVSVGGSAPECAAARHDSRHDGLEPPSPSVAIATGLPSSASGPLVVGPSSLVSQRHSQSPHPSCFASLSARSTCPYP